MEDRCGTLKYWVIMAVKYFFFTILLTIGLVLIDPNYFDVPLGSGEAGLIADQAPPSPFATEITFVAPAGDPIQIVMGAKDKPLPIRTELISPKGTSVMDKSMNLTMTSGVTGNPEWKSLLGSAPENGTYTLRITQDAPGRIKVYFFQGPFVVRMYILPMFSAFLFFLLQMTKKIGKSPTEIKVEPEK